MGNFGRYVCVAVPFVLTLASVVAILVAGLAGVVNKDKSLYMFEINTTNLEIPASSLADLISSRSAAYDFHDHRLLDKADDSTDTPGAASDSTTDSATTDTSSLNVTASELGLAKLYDIGLWNWCYTVQNGTRTCTKPEFNWAQSQLNMTEGNITSLATSAGFKVTLPKEITDAISTFDTISRWTEIVFVIAIVALGLELFFGLFSGCSRALSCITFIVAELATVAVCVFAALATAMSAVVVGAIETSAKWYGVTASINTKYLVAVWVAAAFAIAAGFFWMFTVCCCKPEHGSRRSGGRKRHLDEAGEKLVPVGAYQPITDEHGYQGAYANRHSNPQYGYAPQPHVPHRDLAYEPYSHSRV